MPPQNEGFGAGFGLRSRFGGRTAKEEAARSRIEESETPTHGTAAAAASNVYTWEEVAAHNTAKSLWVTVRGKVYDITRFLDNHPGGKEILLLAAGRDITYAFDSYHPFTDKPQQVLGKYEIGRVSSYEFPRYKEDDRGFYKALCQRVGKYFEETQTNPKDPIPGLWRMALVAVTALCSYLVANGFWSLGFGGVWGQLVAAAVFGVCQALPLLHVMHDSSHLAFGNTETWWKIAGRLAMDFYAGANMTSWHNQHVIGHHIYTNVFLADPDLPDRMEADPRRLVSKQAWRSFYRWQYLYLPPLYGVLGIKFRVQDIMETYGSGANGPVRVNPLGALQWFEMVFTKLFWFAWRVALPLAHPSFHTGGAFVFWPLFLVSEFMTGYFLAFNFQVSHVSTECDYPLGEAEMKQAAEEQRIPDEWAVSQVKSSVDYAHQNWLTTFFCGALNYQVTHHLFPTVSQYHYPAIAPIIQEVCREFQVDYKVLPDFMTAFRAHIGHLKRMGERGEAAEIHMG